MIAYAKILLMYFLICIPLFFHAVTTVGEIRTHRRKVRRCFKCGHIGSMEPYLMTKKPYYLTFALLFAGLIPGLWYLGKVRKKYTCSSCGKITRHIPVSESLSHDVQTPFD